MESKLKQFLFVTDNYATPHNSIDDCIVDARCSCGYGQVMRLRAPLNREYEYLCDIVVDKNISKGGDKHGVS